MIRGIKIKTFSLLTLLILLAISCTNTPVKEGDAASGTAPTNTSSPMASAISYPLVDSGQARCYGAGGTAITCPTDGDAFYGQDAQYTGNPARYQDNGDGTISDLVTGLMWQQDPGDKMTYPQAVSGASSLKLAGYTDWRLPIIKELYSLILFDGSDVSACPSGTTCQATPFIDTRYFKFSYGDVNSGERVIDSQFATSTIYVSTTMNGDETMFGVNFADGRIKGYGTGPMPGQSLGKLFYVLYVRGGPGYGSNIYADNGDGTVTDHSTGLTWMQEDSGAGMNWESALAYCESLTYSGANDWRLPNVKELQSILDYNRSPDTTNSAAIDPIFQATSITNEAGQFDFPFYWSSTTHADLTDNGSYAAYVAFGRAMGYMNNRWMDVHGAGAQRSDPKTGSAAAYPQGHGPQGDAVRVTNYVRCVRGGDVMVSASGSTSEERPTIEIQSTGIDQNQPAGIPGQDQPEGQGGTPPMEAINACSGISQGEPCSFSTPNGTIHGLCQLIEQQLACVPAEGP